MTDNTPHREAQPPIEQRPNHLTFRNSRIIYYGPHACNNCGVLICKMAHEFGGNAFTYPDGPIYPNTEWYPHVCDPKVAKKYMGIPTSAPPSDCPSALAIHPMPTCKLFICPTPEMCRERYTCHLLHG